MSDLNDIVAVGLDLKPQTLVHAYQNGIFPWPSPGLPMLWHCPLKRGILSFDKLHLSRRLIQYLKKTNWTLTHNQSFTEVIEAASDRGDEGTWITDEMKAAYIKLHELGYAHSIEVWDGNALVGGLYGVDVAGYFAGESMFHRKDNASKAALLYVIYLLKQVGREWMDIQMTTPHMQAIGATEISRTQFLKKIKAANDAQKLGTGVAPFQSKAQACASRIYLNQVLLFLNSD